MRLSGKKVLVTGADGFIGSHLVEALAKQKCRVRAFIYYNSFNSWGWVDTFPKDTLKKIEIFAGDVRDPNCIRKAVKDIDVAYHLAALIGIPFSYRAPDSYIDTNIKGTLNMLQACHDTGTDKIIMTSTSEVYGTAMRPLIDESHPLQPQSPYSASKIGADSIAESFYRSFGLPVVIARPFNTYGPRQSARAIIPTIITQLLSGAKTVKLGSLHPTRDMNYISDICSGFIHLAECDKAVGKTVNIGSGSEIAMGDLASMIIKKINPKAKVVSEEARKRPKNSEVERLICDNTLIKKLTGWKPEVTLEEGVSATIEWFRNKKNLEGYKHGIYNV